MKHFYKMPHFIHRIFICLVAHIFFAHIVSDFYLLKYYGEHEKHNFQFLYNQNLHETTFLKFTRKNYHVVMIHVAVSLAFSGLKYRGIDLLFSSSMWF